MFLQIINYHFKDAESKEKGVEFISNTLIPNEMEKFGFISHLFIEGGGNDVFLMYRYKVKENRIGTRVDKTLHYV